MTTKAQPQQILSTGQAVRVKAFRGKVVNSRLITAHNGGQIALTTICFTERFKRGFGQAGSWVKMDKPQTRPVNYSFVQLL